MTVSAIIVTWNSARDIGRCLDALAAQPVAAQVIVVDNASSDGTLEILRAHGQRIMLVGNGLNQGFAAATNQGIGLATGRYLLLLNPDAVLQGPALAEMIALMEANPGWGALGPQLLNRDGSVQPSCREFPRPEHFLYDQLGLPALFPRHRVFGSWRMGYFDHRSRRLVDQPMGACLLVRRDVAGLVGPLDSRRFPMFFNEVDWCYRIRQAGLVIWFDPAPRVTHHHGASTGQARLRMIATAHHSLALFFLKHYRARALTYLTLPLIYASLPFRLLFQFLRLAVRRRGGPKRAQ
jgi:GT2 family glycosyltransferase